MAGEAGFLYESHILKKLQKYDLVPKGFHPAGASNVLPDMMFKKKNAAFKLELKLDYTADFGQGSLSYDVDRKRWEIGGTDTVEGREMQKFLRRVGADTIVNKAWGRFGAPMKYIVPTKKFTQKHVAHDYKYFTDQTIPLTSSSPVDSYYASKQTYYIQVGGSGFYRLQQDPARIGAPHFNPMMALRIRLKRGGSHPINNYRFTTALLIKMKPVPSKFDIDEDPSFLLMD